MGYPDKIVKTVAYADDCIAFLNHKNELCTVLNLISEYGKASGLMLNLSKCEGIWLGVDRTRQKDCKLFGLKWPDQNRYPGIYVGYSRDKNLKRNWDEKIDKVKYVLTSWKDRDISSFGKVQSKVHLCCVTVCVTCIFYWLFRLR